MLFSVATFGVWQTLSAFACEEEIESLLSGIPSKQWLWIWRHGDPKTLPNSVILKLVFGVFHFSDRPPHCGCWQTGLVPSSRLVHDSFKFLKLLNDCPGCWYGHFKPTSFFFYSFPDLCKSTHFCLIAMEYYWIFPMLMDGFGPCVTSFLYNSETLNHWWLLNIS